MIADSRHQFQSPGPGQLASLIGRWYNVRPTITTRQKIRSAEALTDGLAETRAQQKVQKMMMASSIPYIRRRPRALGSDVSSWLV